MNSGAERLVELCGLEEPRFSSFSSLKQTLRQLRDAVAVANEILVLLVAAEKDFARINRNRLAVFKFVFVADFSRDNFDCLSAIRARLCSDWFEPNRATCIKSARKSKRIGFVKHSLN